MILPVPQGLSIFDWANELLIQGSKYDIPQLLSEEAWKDWANRVRMLVTAVNVPLTEGFPTWQDWAAAAMITLQQA